MKYEIYSYKTDELVNTVYDLMEAQMEVDMLGADEYYYVTLHACKTIDCKHDANERFDAYGITTGWWCDSCFNSNKYPYRKDKYPTIETHGFGERLNND